MDQPPELLDQVRHKIRLKHFSIRAEDVSRWGVRSSIDAFTRFVAVFSEPDLGAALSKHYNNCPMSAFVDRTGWNPAYVFADFVIPIPGRCLAPVEGVPAIPFPRTPRMMLRGS